MPVFTAFFVPSSRPLLITDGPSHLVEGETLVTPDGDIAVVVLPWGEHEQTALGASVEAFASGLGERRKAIFLQNDGGEASLKDGTQDVFLSWADAGRDNDCTVLCLAQAVVALGGELFGSYIS